MHTKDFLLKHAAKDAISFHMPGHKGSEIYRQFGYNDFLEHFMDCDVTEIPGADNLFQTEGILKETQERYARLYDAKHSYLLVNGTSGGLIAAILATVPPGKKLIMARNCHKSIFNALTLGNIEPVYAYPEMIPKYGITGSVPPEEIKRLLEENPEAEAVILPSPNYYGICSDIQSIARIVHDAGKVLIVDQAHGAHLKFFHKYGYGGNLPKAAEDCGADIVVNSTHKTLASLTQSAVLNLLSDRVDRHVLEDKLQAIQSTSPSYVLMASLDINANLLEKHGAELMKEWKDNLDFFSEQAATIDGLKLMDVGNILDRTKLNLDMGSLGISGGELEELLIARGIYSELFTGDILMCMTGIGNTKKDLAALADALKEIAAGSRENQNKTVKQTISEGQTIAEKEALFVPPQGKLHPVPKYREFISLSQAKGRICASSIIPYPPGIPFVCPGEELTEEIIRYIKALRKAGEKVIGVTEEGKVSVGKRTNEQED